MSIPFPENKATFLLPAPAGQLEVMTTKPVTGKPIIGLICHPNPTQEGTMHNKVVTTIARAFEQMGLATVRFNFRGVGKSTGEFAETAGEKQDLLAVLNWVKQVLPDYTIWLAGFSFGSYIAASVANQQDVKQLVSIAPPVNMYEFNQLSNIGCPWLIVQGDKDEIVSCIAVKEFVSASPSCIDFIEMQGAGHFFHGRLIDLRECLKEKLSIS